MLGRRPFEGSLVWASVERVLAGRLGLGAPDGGPWFRLGWLGSAGQPLSGLAALVAGSTLVMPRGQRTDGCRHGRGALVPGPVAVASGTKLRV
jgi:hypothetical protein